MNRTSLIDPTPKLVSRDARTIALLIGLLVAAIGIASYGPSRRETAAALPAAQAADVVCDDGLAETDEQPWVRTELFFGTSKPDGAVVTESEWRAFLDQEITARFPDGLTVLTGLGQWQEEDDDIIQERSKIVILLYPGEYAQESGAKIEEIRSAYETQFQQESVLRADDSRPVCTSF
jgi:hypothetical protein